MTTSDLLELRDLCVSYGTPERPLPAVAHVDLAIRPGEIIGIAGESGSGKSTLCSAMIRALPDEARVAGDIVFAGRSLNAMGAAELRRLRGREISMILQNPMTSLDPLFTIGDQLGEVLTTRAGVSAAERGRRVVDVLRAVHLTAPERRVHQYPHELSGGMRQRVLIGMASAAAPKLLLADEPTTALDATIQEEILVLFNEIRDRHGTAIVVVTHDLGVIRRLCDRIVIMYLGRIVEEGPVETIFESPRHPYTRALLESIPRIDGKRGALRTIPGQVPSLADAGENCAFAPRCARVQARCRTEIPRETRIAGDHRAFCWDLVPRP
ncbi:MAG: ABC transporter ATP-binding protein [Alphaproteobacteria bacterium]|nr:ABC transporter ATP-binding protein [Alphaproteobacteria bacterium]